MRKANEFTPTILTAIKDASSHAYVPVILRPHFRSPSFLSLEKHISKSSRFVSLIGHSDISLNKGFGSICRVRLLSGLTALKRLLTYCLLTSKSN